LRALIAIGENFIGLLESIGAADARTAARCIRAFSPSNSAMTRAERNAFDAGVRTLFDERCRGYDSGVEFGDVVRGVLQLVRVHRVRINANYATLIVNALCLVRFRGSTTYFIWSEKVWPTACTVCAWLALHANCAS
jgi:hypothetical protein